MNFSLSIKFESSNFLSFKPWIFWSFLRILIYPLWLKYLQIVVFIYNLLDVLLQPNCTNFTQWMYTKGLFRCNISRTQKNKACSCWRPEWIWIEIFHLLVMKKKGFLHLSTYVYSTQLKVDTYCSHQPECIFDSMYWSFKLKKSTI